MVGIGPDWTDISESERQLMTQMPGTIRREPTSHRPANKGNVETGHSIVS